jgi:hypothetical protein
MKAVAIGALGFLVSILTCIDDASAQRGRNSQGFHGRGINTVSGRHGVGAIHSHGHAAPHGFRGHRGRWHRGIAPVVVIGGGSVGSGDNCVFEQRLVWNGWATLREVVTVCQ